MRAILSPAPGMFIAKVETECGEQGYTCLTLKPRHSGTSSSILEMKVGHIKSQYNDVSCTDSDLVDPLHMVIQVRDRVACPLSGEWWGVIPDAEGLCARSVTLCARPDHMQYQVYN